MKVNYCPIEALSPQEPYKYHVILQNPLILVSVDFASIDLLLETLKNKRLRLFLICSWNFDNRKYLERAIAWERWCEGNKKHSIVHLANTVRDKETLDRYKIKNIFCNQNCLLDEKIFTIDNSRHQRYNAIYDARLASFKRHFLASKVERLALLAYAKEEDYLTGYFRAAYNDLANATWLSGPFARSGRYIQDDEVACFLNQAQVGLVLSAEEGANWASIQYLCCGLPIVSTPSRGGRDIFFNSDYVITADANPKSVAEAVCNLVKRDIDRKYIRGATLLMMEKHRQVLLGEIKEYLVGELAALKIMPSWLEFFKHKMLVPHSQADLKELEALGGS